MVITVAVEAQAILQMDCGWQNPGGAAKNCLGCLRFLASKPNCIGPVGPPQTSGMREFPFPFAMMISFQPTSRVA